MRRPLKLPFTRPPRVTRFAPLARAFIALAAAAGADAGCRGRTPVLGAFDADMPAIAPIPALPPVAPPAEEPHEVHFTFTAPDAVTFDWRGHDNTVRLWAHNIPPRTIEGRTPSVQPFSSPGPWQEAVVDRLVPGTEYTYEVGHPVRPLSISFRAPPPRGAADFTFVAVGDIGAIPDWPAAAVTHRLIRLADPLFVLALGDLTYGDIRSQVSVDRHFDDAMAWSERSAYMPVWGNHEWENPRGDDLRNYKGRFALPHAARAVGAPAVGCCGEDWYWFDVGAVRFVVYPEPYTDATWPDWARQAEPLFAEAERNASIRFVVTTGHRPAYSSGHHGGEPQLRRILDGFGRQFPKYVLNIDGHSHDYERTKPQGRIVHVTVGTGGGPLEHAPTPCLWQSCAAPPFTAFRAIHHAFLKVHVRPTELVLEAICGAAAAGNEDVRCADGEILDSTTIPAGGSGPAERADSAGRSARR